MFTLIIKNNKCIKLNITSATKSVQFASDLPYVSKALSMTNHIFSPNTHYILC